MPAIVVLSATDAHNAVSESIDVFEIAVMALEAIARDFDAHITPVRHAAGPAFELEVPGNHIQVLAGELEDRRALAGLQSQESAVALRMQIFAGVAFDDADHVPAVKVAPLVLTDA